MAKQNDDQSLWNGSPVTTKFSNEHANLESWNGAIDITPYKKAQAWPGQSYCLMGNSFDVQVTEVASPKYLRRAASIKTTLSRPTLNTNCITVKEALSNEEFLAVLSRFERDWLARLRTDALIGPAYNEAGELIEVAFSVWQRHFVSYSKSINEH